MADPIYVEPTVVEGRTVRSKEASTVYYVERITTVKHASKLTEV